MSNLFYLVKNLASCRVCPSLPTYQGRASSCLSTSYSHSIVKLLSRMTIMSRVDIGLIHKKYCFYTYKNNNSYKILTICFYSFICYVSFLQQGHVPTVDMGGKEQCLGHFSLGADVMLSRSIAYIASASSDRETRPSLQWYPHKQRLHRLK